MKVYFFLSNLSESDYDYFLDKLQFINSQSDIEAILEKYTHKIWESPKWRTHRAAFVEALVFLKYILSNKKDKIYDIEWVYKKNFLIFNQDIYEDTQDWWKVIQDKTLFVTTRDTFKHPFFHYIWLGKVNKNITLIKPNYNKVSHLNDKTYFIWKIWEKRKQYVWDIVIPFAMNTKIGSIQRIFNFVKINIGNKCVIKNNFGVEWKMVRALDLNTLLDRDIDILSKEYFSWNIYNNYTPYFISYYEIKSEYRIYFTYFDKNLKVYSVKNKFNTTKDGSNIFTSGSFYKKDISITWRCCSNEEFKKSKYDNIKEVYENIIPKLWLQMWVLELCENQDGEIRFIEVNPMWGTLMFPWEDETNIHNYYLDMWQSLLD